MINEGLHQAQGTTTWSERRQAEIDRGVEVYETTSATVSVPGTRRELPNGAQFQYRTSSAAAQSSRRTTS